MPLMIFDVKGVPSTCWERDETAVVAGAGYVRKPDGSITSRFAEMRLASTCCLLFL
jgi:hypothetical protein